MFDTMFCEMLWQVLAGLEVEGRFLRCLHAMYAKDTIRINHPNKSVTSSFKCQQGVKQGCPLNPLLFRLYLDALEGRLDGRKCDAPALVDVHVWLLLFCRWPCSDVGIKGGIATTVRRALAFLCSTWVYHEREKNKSHVVQLC